jgi:hypothetical protein
LLGGPQSIRFAGLPFQDDREFVTADSARHIAFGQHALYSPARFLEYAVPHGVAHRIVDLLEAIEIDEEHRQRSGWPALKHSRVQEFDQVGAIGQSSE